MTDKKPTHEVVAFWNACRSRLPIEKVSRMEVIPEAWAFGNNAKMADELGALVLEGKKTATCGILWEYEAEEEPIPRSGEFSIILNGAEDPICLIETIQVNVIPFEDVDAQFAYDEGEDDRTLDSWRREHWKFFSRYLVELNRQPEMDMPLVCERFRLVLKADDLK